MSIPENFHRHKNGGGLVADTASVRNTVYVGPNALVGSEAKVFGNAMICDYAKVHDHAKIYGNARVGGNAKIFGDAWVGGRAKVYGNAWVGGRAVVYGNAKVYGDAVVSGIGRVHGDAVISGKINIIDGGIMGIEIWGVYDSIKDQWVDCENNKFDDIIGYEWNTIKNIQEEGVFAIPLIDCVPNFSGGIEL